MDFKQLEAFVQVVKQGSFSAAAARLYLTQPTVSTHIAVLEQEMETPLIVRAARGAYPTEAGQRLYEYALELLTLRNKAVAACKSVAGELEGTIAIAASTIPHQYVLPALMSRFRALHEGVTFQVNSGDSSDAVRSLLSGKADICIIGTEPESDKCICTSFMEDSLVIIAPATRPFQALTQLRAEDLPGYPFIVREPGSGTRREMELYLEQKGISLKALQIVAQMDDPDAIKRAVEQGLGISILSRLSVEEEERQGRIRIFAPQEGDIRRKLYLAHHSSRPLSAVALAFIRFVLADSTANL